MIAGLLLLGVGLAGLTTPSSSTFRLLGVEKPPFPQPGGALYSGLATSSNSEEILRAMEGERTTRGKLDVFFKNLRPQSPSPPETRLHWILMWLVLPVLGMGVGAGVAIVSLRSLLDEFVRGQ
jgi:hypothetical protein